MLPGILSFNNEESKEGAEAVPEEDEDLLDPELNVSGESV